MNEETNNINGKIPPNAANASALSLFDQTGGMNDFPVLKAFQEYIDAEQARSRKRMLGLSIFFLVLLVVVVITFSVVMAAVITRDQNNLTAITRRNQELSDRLLDIALRERTQQQPVVNVQPTVQPQPAIQQPSQDAALKPLIEKIDSLAGAISGRQIQAQIQTQTEELRRRREALEAEETLRAERAKLAIEKELKEIKLERERLRKEEVELQRRKLYPEHYAREDASKKVSVSASVAPPPPAKKRVAAKPAAAVKQQPSQTTVQPKPVDLKTAKPISYFDEPENEPQTKTSVQQQKSIPKTETLNIGSKDGAQVPFLLEL